MYRKYSPIRTYVLNSHHYLIAAEQHNTNQPTLFHQLLLPETLPVLFDSKTLQNCIDESQNQNIVSETAQGFEVYFDRNLVQVRVRQGVRLLSEVGSMCFGEVLQTVRALNLDFAMAVKQLQANSKNSQMDCLNHCCKFYACLAMREGGNELILPFVQVASHKLHYYDVFYGGMFAKPVEKGKKVEGKKGGNGQKKLKLKNGSVIPGSLGALWGEAAIFRKYVLFLVVALTCEDVVELMQEFRAIASNDVSNVEISERIEKGRGKMGNEVMGFVELLKRCLERPEEYNINIFQKECELLNDKYQKMKDGKGGKEEVKMEMRQKIHVEREEKTHGSRSLIACKKKTMKEIPVAEGRPVSKKGNERLKSSKSLINLKRQEERDVSTSSHKLKRPALNMFKSSKMDVSAHQFGSTQKVLKGLKTDKCIFEGSSSGFMVKSFNFSKLGSTSSSWLNSTGMKETDTFNRLRNFKKGNQNASANVSPVNRPSMDNAQIKIQKDFKSAKQEVKAKCEESDMSRGSEDCLTVSGDLKHLSRFFSKYKPNKNKKEGCKIVAQEQGEHENSKYEDKDEEQNVKQIKEGSQSVSKSISRRTITNTVNLKLCEKQNVSLMIEGIPQKVVKQKLGQQQKQGKRNLGGVVNKDESKKQKSFHQNIQNQQKGRNDELKNCSMMKKPKGNYPVIKGTNLTDSSIDEQIEQISFKGSSMIGDSMLLSSKLQFSTPLAQSVELSPQQSPQIYSQKPQTQKKLEDRVKETEEKQQNNSCPFLQLNQKVFYTKHFQLMLLFFNENKLKLNSLPHKGNLVYLINMFYYKTLIENRPVEKVQKYAPLIALIKKLREKIPEESKKTYLLFRVDVQSLFYKHKSIQLLQNKIRKSKSGQLAKEEETREEISVFVKITQQCCLLLQKILDQLYRYFQANKAMLINKNIFLTVLQLGYMINVTRIICLQSLKYYKWMQDPIQGQKIFAFQFKTNEKEYLQDYRKKISVQEPAFVNCLQEYANLKSWVDQYG